MKSNHDIHTTACGAVPYDHVYNVGANKDGEIARSPYERINRLRDFYHNKAENYVSAKRLKIWTEVYKENESLPPILKKARAMKKYMETCDLSYNEGELVLLNNGCDVYHSHLYPEYTDWFYEEMEKAPLYERDSAKALYESDVEEIVPGTREFWRGKSTLETIKARMPEDCAKGCQEGGGILIFNPQIMIENGPGHKSLNYDYALKKGLSGVKADVRAAIEKIGTPTTMDALKALQLHEAQLTVLDGISIFFRRYAAFAKEQVDKYSSQQTKDELLRMSEMCEKLAEDAPCDFWEALMLFSAIFHLQNMESNSYAISLGRMDQYLYPYYKYSLDNGIYTKDFMQELLDFVFLYMNTPGHVMRYNPAVEFYNGGTKGFSTGTAVIVGGVDKDGNDVTNDLSFMILDCIPHVRLSTPWLTVRWHDGTPYELKVKAVNVMRVGTGHPKILNDNVCIEAMMRLGVPLEDARDYANIGCTELEIPGKTEGWQDISGINIPKVFELAINNGRCLNCNGENCPNYHRCAGVGKPIGLETGYLKDFKTYEEVVDAYMAQLKYWCDRHIMLIELMQSVHAELDDYPFTSCFIEGCTESGKSLNQGGAKYNFTGIQVLGFATVADSLAVLKQLVYEDKTVTAGEFHDALVKNWEGYERLYQLVNSEKVHHYGNDDNYVDEIMKDIYDMTVAQIQAYPPTRGGIGKIKTGSFSQVANLFFGMYVGATPDGRKAHEAISENIGPARTAHSSHDRNGPTALAKSIGKFDHCKNGGGCLINYKFGAETVSSEQGRDNLLQFLEGYFEDDPQHIQVMITDRNVLIDAQKNPEQYQDLLVRVSGFSAFFTKMGRSFQDELINRTEHSLD